MRSISCALALLVCLVVPLAAGDATASFVEGQPPLQSIGSLAFGPDGVLFIGDSRGGTILALATDDQQRDRAEGDFQETGIDAKIASLLGTSVDQIQIHDMVVGPHSGAAYLSVSRGQGPEATPVLVRVDRSGEIAEVPLDNVRYSMVELPNPPDPNAERRGRSLRQLAITDLAYLSGKVYVAGLSNEEFSSKLRVIDFPFAGVDSGTSVEIYHGNHGKWETHSPIRTLVPYEIASNPHILAAYTCTPLVKFPVKSIASGDKITGTTIAELGNRNRPLDMIVYKKEGRDYILMANSSRGVMKVSTRGIAEMGGITEPVDEFAGLPYETLTHLTGVQQLDRLDESRALVLMQGEGGVDLKAVPLP